MKKYCRPFILVLACLAASDAPAQNPTPTQPPAYVDEAPLPKGWPKPGPYDQVSEKSYPPYRAAFTTAKRENGAFGTLFSHIQKNDIPMTAPVEISMAEGDDQNLRQTSLAFLYQDTAVGKTGADGANVEVRDVPAMKTLSYTWQGDRNEANIAKAKVALEAALKDRKIEAKEFRLLGYNGPGIPETKRTWELQALLRTSALATPPVPTSATPPATSTTLGSASAPQAPKVAVEKSDLQPAAGEKFDPSEIRQALSELLALKEGVGSNQQIQEKKAALKAAVERGIKQDPKSVLKLLFGFTHDGSATYIDVIGEFRSSFVQRYPEFAIALLDQVPEGFIRCALANLIGSEWAESDLKAAFAWANQQTDPEIKSAILVGVISSWGKTDLKGALAYAQSMPPGASQDRAISGAFEKNCFAARGYQGALAMMQSLPEGRINDLAAKGISDFMSLDHPRAAWDLDSGIGDSNLRSSAEFRVVIQLSMGSLTDPDAATQWMQSLPKGDTKDRLSAAIIRPIAKNHPQVAMDIAAGIGDSNRRTEAQKNVVEQWLLNDPAAATQWIKNSALPQEVKTQLLQR